MSFILDALKKSEHERQDRSGPDLAYAPGVREREKLPRWVYILGALLLVNLVALGGMFLFDGPSQASRNPVPVTAGTGPRTPPEPAAEPAAASVSQGAYTKAPGDQAAAPVGVQARASAESVPTPSGETKGPNEARPLQREAGAPGKEPAASAGGPGTAQSTAAQPEPTRPAASYSQDSLAEPLPPTLDQLHGEGKLMSLQSLSLDLHVYTEAADGRFVFVNLNRYREGERLREGPLVEQITPDGVILQHMGERFLVPRS